MPLLAPEARPPNAAQAVSLSVITLAVEQYRENGIATTHIPGGSPVSAVLVRDREGAVHAMRAESHAARRREMRTPADLFAFFFNGAEGVR